MNTPLERLLNEYRKYFKVFFISIFLAVWFDLLFAFYKYDYDKPLFIYGTIFWLVVLAIYRALRWRVIEKNRVPFRDIIYWNGFIYKVCKKSVGIKLNFWQKFLYYFIFPERIFSIFRNRYYDIGTDTYFIEGIKISGQFFRDTIWVRPNVYFKVIEVEEGTITVHTIPNLVKYVTELESELKALFDNSYISERISDASKEFIMNKLEDIKRNSY